jgi:iron complex outermembrane receptor protein
MKYLPKLLFFLAIPATAYTQTPGKPRDTVPPPQAKVMQEATVTGHTPPIQHRKDRTIINVEASPTNAGTTVLDVLEKSPGVTVDRNGGISLNGKPGVLVMIDDKLTYLSGADLNNLLSSMNAGEVAKIELIPNPPARYDATGTAGIINIKTKRSDNAGLNGSLTTSYAQGVYPKTNNSLILNYKTGRIRTFLNYSINDVGYLTSLYAYRKYYDQNNNVTAILQQPSYFHGTVVNNTARTGLDYLPSANTTVGFELTGIDIHRSGSNTSHANWLDPAGNLDSSVLTTTTPKNSFRNGAINLHARQALTKNTELRMDLDYLHYQMLGTQNYDNQLLEPGGYDSVFRSSIPTTIDIYSGKLDAETSLGAGITLQTGIKLSSSHTTNAATYQDLENQQWVTDETRSTQFTYQENIQAAYAQIEGKFRTISYDAGLRYEYTAYTISAVSHNYGSFFPSTNLSWQIDTLQSLTLTAGRRIDRPPYQNLNPFLYIINKYTYATGNPYLLPQYSWNFDLTHQYGELLTTTLSYSLLTNYFSQIFVSDSTGTILFYTQGNVGTVNNLGASENVTLKPARWWTLQAGAVFNYKRFHGFNGNDYTSTISQLTVNVTNQFTFRNGFVAELSGFYTTRAREDIQELQYPTGQAAAGISKPVLKKKGTIKLNFRDILYTGSFSGLTSFPNASEYFKIQRDSRVIALSFTYRFGKSYKVAIHNGGATEEEERAPKS